MSLGQTRQSSAELDPNNTVKPQELHYNMNIHIRIVYYNVCHNYSS